MKQKLLSLFMAFIATTALWAYDCEVDGICYNLNSTNWTAEVTHRSKPSYYNEGSIVIPSTITYNSRTNSVTTIGDYAFNSCDGLISVTLGNSVKTIGQAAFYMCSSLTSVTIPNSVTTIGESAFSSCMDLASVTIGNSVTTIGYSAFAKCDSLTSIEVDATNTHYCSIDGVLFNYTKETLIQYPIGNNKTEYIIPNFVTTIGVYAFCNCHRLTSITIPNSVTSIENSAFSGCTGLTSIVLPFSVTTIGDRVFDNIYSLNIICYSDKIVERLQNIVGLNHSIDHRGVKATISDLSPSSFFISNSANTDKSVIANWKLSINKQTYVPDNSDNILCIGLHPQTTFDCVQMIQLTGESEWIEDSHFSFTTPELTFTTLVPKVVSAGTAVVAAETNISDYETNVGFEWRKYDAPESMPSKSGAAILFNGIMEGKLLNLSTDAYWNVRPYYEAADGTRYYGEWITFDPGDFSYFEPTVHTYALATSPTANNVQVRGYVMTGTDDVTEQGFEYWFKGGQKAPHRAPTATPDSVYRVTASGQVMSAVLEDLAYSSTYTCRAYAIAGGKTYYGEEVQFLTPEDPRPIYTLTVLAGENGSVNAEVSGQYREGEQVTLTATPNVGYQFEQWSDGNTKNPYILTIMQDTEITATFKQAESGLTNLPCNIKATKYFHNGNLTIERNGIKYTATGQKVK